MRFFRKKPSLVDEIDSLVCLEKRLEVRQQCVGPVHRSLLLFALALALSGSLILRPYLAAALWALTALLLLALPASRRAGARRLSAVRAAKDAKARELLTAVEDTSSFISQMRARDAAAHEIADFSSISPACELWDRVTHKYTHNRRALVCPFCRAHNGLADDVGARYVCPNCRRTVGARQKGD